MLDKDKIMTRLDDIHSQDWVQRIAVTGANSVDVTVRTTDGKDVIFQVYRQPSTRQAESAETRQQDQPVAAGK